MKVSIIGKGLTWEQAPLDVESWGLTQLVLKRPVDLTIDMNIYEDGRWGNQQTLDAREARKICEQKRIPYIDLTNYPIREIVEEFKTDYFSSTVDYAIALALYRGYTDIHLYGITMAHASDYHALKCGCDFWCGYAKGLGANVTTHGSTTVMLTVDKKVYGYDVKQGTLLEKYRESILSPA